MSDSSLIRIAVLRHAYFPDDARIYKEVHALRDAGYDVTLLCLRKPGEKPFEDKEYIHIHRLPMGHRRGSKVKYVMEYALSMFLMGWKLSCLAFQRRFSAIQVNTLPDSLIFVTLIPRLLGSRILLDLHEPTPELYDTIYGSSGFRFVRYIHVFIERYAIRFAHHVLTVNESIRQRFIDRGAPADKITVIRNVPAEDILVPSVDRKTPDSKYLLMTHGTLQPRYGQDVLIKAMPQIRKFIPNVKLQIIGKGEIEPDLRKLADSLDCKDIIEFTGEVPLKRISNYLIQADVGVIPLNRSPFSELCQPNKLFEYIALKVPVITVRLPAIEESFNDKCMIFINPENIEELARAVIELYQNPEKGRQRAECAYERYQQLRWNVTKKIYLQAIGHLLGHSRNS